MPDNTKFEWEKHSHIEPLTDDEFEEIKQEAERMRGIADDAMYHRLIATVEDLRAKLMKQSHVLGEMKQERGIKTPPRN